MSSKKKGNNFERQISKIFSDHFKLKFVRVPTSGAIGKIHKDLDIASLVMLSGDIICPPHFRFSVECKFGYDIDISKLLSSKKSKSLIYKFLGQADRDAGRVGKIPLVLYKRNNFEILALIPFCWLKHSTSLTVPYMVVSDGNIDWIILPLSILLEQERSFFFAT